MVKQVIVMRKDLGMRKGKMVAQGAHASLGVILDLMSRYQSSMDEVIGVNVRKLMVKNGSAMEEWLDGSFTKVCLSCDSEDELVELFRKAFEAGIPTKLITDSGKTEFNGVPTKTCVAIGPARSEDIDKITGHLKSL